jgi:hypothetical protein
MPHVFIAHAQKRDLGGVPHLNIKFGMARVTGLEPATFGVTGRRSNQLSYTRIFSRDYSALRATVTAGMQGRND